MPWRNAGPRLVALIESRLDEGQSLRNFALGHGLDHTRFHAWRQGTTPGLDQLRQVATALEMRLGDLLVECGYGTRDEFSVVEVVEYVADVDEAIKRDPKLDDLERELVQRSMEIIRQARSDAGHSARWRGKRKA